jgi:hypothetical protein
MSAKEAAERECRLRWVQGKTHALCAGCDQRIPAGDWRLSGIESCGQCYVPLCRRCIKAAAKSMRAL